MTLLHHHPSHRASRPAPRAARAFTLLELLTVVAIIVVLLALIGGVGFTVLRGQKASITQNLLETLNRALDEYVSQTGAIPPYVPTAYRQVPGPDNDGIPVFAPYPPGGEHPKRPDAAVFLRQAKGVGEAQAIIAGLSEQFLIPTIRPAGASWAGSLGPEIANDPTPSVIDGWGSENWPADPDDAEQRFSLEVQQVVYFVHPQNRLAQDLYGQCVNGRPYFLSAGPDLKYGLTSEFSELPAADQRAAAENATADNLTSYTVGPIKKGMAER